MKTANTIDIFGPAHAVYAYASETQRWPEFLPHYRYVRVLDDSGTRRIVEMAAKRDAIPISWIAEQWNDPAVPEIRFHHIAGWTRGMDVVWRFETLPGFTRVTIEHDLTFAFPIAAEFIGEHVVGRFFVHDVAGKTLSRMKALVERTDGA